MDKTDKEFEEVLQEARNRAGIEIVKNVQSHLNIFTHSHNILNENTTITTSNTSN